MTKLPLAKPVYIDQESAEPLRSLQYGTTYHTVLVISGTVEFVTVGNIRLTDTQRHTYPCLRLRVPSMEGTEGYGITLLPST
jgi:hypothetical protein